MNEFIQRQHDQVLFKIAEYRRGSLDLNHLTNQLEGLAHAIGESFWTEQMFPLIFDLERINSEIIDKKRNPTPKEESDIEVTLKAIEKIIAKH